VRSDKLSGGTKRKMLVATIVASGARILFVDEPTTGLDPISRQEMWRALKRLKETHFIFLTTHYLEEAEELADRIGIVDNGKLLAIGTVEELRNRFKYQYSIRVQKGSLSGAVKPKPGMGVVKQGIDGASQILANKEEALRISNLLAKGGAGFSMNPISLEDMFYYLVRSPINYGEDSGSEEW
ncbi:MAG: AAA family ATPase, partial [Candidatus Micrarchaeaceae archaeon]